MAGSESKELSAFERREDGSASAGGLRGVVAGLRVADVDAALVLRAGDALMANDDACVCLLVGQDALVLASDAGAALSVINPALAAGLIESGRIATVRLAAPPRRLARRRLFGLLAGHQFASGIWRRQDIEADLAGLPREPVTGRDEVSDAV